MLVKYFLISIAVLFLSACSIFQKKDPELTITDTKTIYVKVPESLLTDCKPDAPMATDRYMSLTLDERELTLSKYILTLYGTIAVCNTQIGKIKKYNDGNGGGAQ